MTTTTKNELAAAVGAGYLLGRTRQLTTAVTLARAGGRTPRGPHELLVRGSELLASSPEIAKLGEQARSELLDATATAAAAETGSGHSDSFRDRLRAGGASVVTRGEHLLAGLTRIGRRDRAHRPDVDATATADEEPGTGKDEDGQVDHSAAVSPTPPGKRARRGRGKAASVSSGDTTASEGERGEDTPTADEDGAAGQRRSSRGRARPRRTKSARSATRQSAKTATTSTGSGERQSNPG
ncbi:MULTISPECIES: hypothetical protein [unclassified Rhodococcus (in: high G+C Gram-positive bacteria)]|uniref:hypothetical protein n=1 Tax=unclassified Rhodococcus (in: high G+C Gram-positive bacteria) TaxID=192944 RepID=UPI00163B230D|nr:MULTISPECIES: hypothetical protein [unclassified Rhodococcus (in: high G+C Gram-positive bacteria)]MBC2638221.1 hypothetical protein [Rhodococcus sp. 3A]MBC2897036.1 hypothetical protein [Rhodococcus sp. 4CII]